jgi:hypothetical protein
MAKVMQVKLHPVAQSGDKATVTVDYDLEFEAAEVGKTFKVVVQLWPKDGPDDEEQGTFSFNPQPLYTFSFGSTFFNKKRYRTVVPQSTSLSQTAVNTLNSDTLDEDPGHYKIKNPGGGTYALPHDDEIYAKVILSRESTASSEPVTFFA